MRHPTVRPERTRPTTMAGSIALAALAPALALAAESTAEREPAGFEGWVARHKIPVGDAVTALVEFVKHHGAGFFDGLSVVVRGSIDAVLSVLLAIPAPALILAVDIQRTPVQPRPRRRQVRARRQGNGHARVGAGE